MRIEYKANRSQRTVRDNVGNALVSRGIARQVGEANVVEPKPVMTQNAAINTVHNSDIPPIAEKPKRRYKRRDMKAER